MRDFPSSSTRRRVLRLLGTTAAAWGLGASAQALPQAQPSLQQLRIGYQKASVSLVLLKQWGALEKRFPGTRVAWIEFPAGPQLLEALAAGSLEFGMTGDSPPVFAQAAGKDLLYVGVEPPKPDSSAIIVPADSPLRGLADLKAEAEQQRVADTYLKLGLIPRPVRIADIVWHPDAAK